MFEDYSYDNLLAEMLSNVATDVDKREGSIIFDTLSPAALELANAYMGLDTILNNAFADSAERDYLVKIAKERGITPEDSTSAILKAEFNFNSSDGNYIGEVVSTGDRFNLDKINYTLVAQMTNNTDVDITVTDNDGNNIVVSKGNIVPGCWQIMCDTTGEEGNKHFGTLTPIVTISGLTKAEITELIIPGEEEEDTETFRQRYFDSINSDAFGGNRANYIKWVKEMEGVGQVKANRTPNGGGTVEIIITDSEGSPASDELINSVKEKLDPADSTGLGEGIAPIGHSVTVNTVKYVSKDIYFNDVEYTENADKDAIKLVVENILSEYANEINSDWENRTTKKIYAAQILARCIDVDGIENIENVDIEDSSYITLNEKQLIAFEIGGGLE